MLHWKRAASYERVVIQLMLCGVKACSVSSATCAWCPRQLRKCLTGRRAVPEESFRYSVNKVLGIALHLQPATLKESKSHQSVRRLLLQQMAPEHRFETGARLTREVLAAFCGGCLSVQESPEVLHDTLAILGSKDLQVC